MSTCIWCAHGDHEIPSAESCSCACHGEHALMPADILGVVMARAAEKLPACDQCGGSCEDGHRIGYHGQPDPETGYRDQSIICSACDEEDGKFEAADASYEMSVEDGT